MPPRLGIAPRPPEAPLAARTHPAYAPAIVNPMEYIHVVMTRANLQAIPRHDLPDRYRLRNYAGPQDDDAWVRIWDACDDGYEKLGIERFEAEFGSDRPALNERMLFLVSPDGADVGTITAWYDRTYRGRNWGRVHWVAIVPDHRGRGLAKAMMTACLQRLKALGHRRAVLGTQTIRLPAIKVYLDFGFRPDMTYPRAAEAWDLIRRNLRHPALGSA